MDPLQIASWSLFPTLFIFLLQQNFHIFVRFHIQTMTNHVSEMMVALLLPFMLDDMHGNSHCPLENATAVAQRLPFHIEPIKFRIPHATDC